QFALIRQLDSGKDQSTLDAIARTVTRLQGNFRELTKEFEQLGVDNDTGIRVKLRRAADDIERIINLDMSWLADGIASRLIEGLLSMRRYEAAYMLDRNFADRAA